MSRFFVLTTDPLTAEQEQQLAEFVKVRFTWWHWMPNFWLLRDDSDAWTVEAIRDQFTTIAFYARCVILQVDPIDWNGRVKPDAQGNRMEDWINAYWRRP